MFRNIPTPNMGEFAGPNWRYHQWRQRARWFTLAAFDYEIAIQRDGLRDAIDFDFFCQVRAKGNPIPRDPFIKPRPIVLHETSGHGSAVDSYSYFVGHSVGLGFSEGLRS